MRIREIDFPDGQVRICFDASLYDMPGFHDKKKIVIITDENIFNLHKEKFEGYPVIKIPGGEKNKKQSSVDEIIHQLLEMDIDKTWLLAGVGGGVVTDIAGYAASIYKRGIRLGLVPTTILGMTDAAIGGKNGVNVGMYKNMVGTKYRPEFILYDFSFLETLPEEEWINGFAEIIKHACIKDAQMFKELSAHSIEYYRENKNAIALLVEKNTDLKISVVVNDEHETGERFLLNFGHTFGHAIENLYDLPHGSAISIGMVIAAKISEEINNFDSVSKERLIKLLQQYGLPVSCKTDHSKVLALLKKDKKRSGNHINFVLLNSIGEGVVKQLSFHNIEALQDQIL